MGFFSKAPMPAPLVTDVVAKQIIRPKILKLGIGSQQDFQDVESEIAGIDSHLPTRLPSRLPMAWTSKYIVFKGAKPKAAAKPIKKDMPLPLKSRGIYAQETAMRSGTSAVAKPSQKQV